MSTNDQMLWGLQMLPNGLKPSSTKPKRAFKPLGNDTSYPLLIVPYYVNSGFLLCALNRDIIVCRSQESARTPYKIAFYHLCFSRPADSHYKLKFSTTTYVLSWYTTLSTRNSSQSFLVSVLQDNVKGILFHFGRENFNNIRSWLNEL